MWTWVEFPMLPEDLVVSGAGSNCWYLVVRMACKVKDSSDALYGDIADISPGKEILRIKVKVLRMWKVPAFLNPNKAALQNVMNTTRILVNPDIPEVDNFKNSIAVHGIEIGGPVPMIGDRPKPSMEEEFLRMHPKKSVSELSGLCEDGVFVVCVEVVGIVDGHDWWYPACKCHKAVIADSGSYFCSGCNRHVFQVVPRFRVKIEATDGKDSGVFVIFDSDMSYIMEKSCSYFVARNKANGAGLYPNEFDSLVGKKMLLAVNKPLKECQISDGSHRVKRICLDPTIIERFCAEGPYFTPSKRNLATIDLDSDGLSDEANIDDDDSQPLEFLKDLIVTPPSASNKTPEKDVVGGRLKRNLSKAFDVVAKPPGPRRLRKVKIEED
ncbi:hypothetical protein TSUD_275630 [Trifolium subterraneum]|uniref:Replication factor A C-terminal domain-containing protein n=1 Tax=Trifolium subterraneum TaxID=3900 RepID=A0A2Z6N1D6_TRISU|nr:hypothetical protein TSUD_275630 [Trifolium subterraneum]